MRSGAAFSGVRGMETKPLRTHIPLPSEAEPERAVIEVLVENDETRIESECPPS